MSTMTQKQALADAVNSIRLAEKMLLDESRATSDVSRLIQINTEYTHLDSYMSQILHVQALTDDAEFGNAVAALQSQVSALHVEQQAITNIVADVEKAAKIVGYIARAAEALTVL